MKHLEVNEPEVRTTMLSIAGMSCGACLRHVTKALDGMTGVVHARVDLRTSEAFVERLPAFVDAASLIAALAAAGYTAQIVEMVDDAEGKLVGIASAARARNCCGPASRRDCG